MLERQTDRHTDGGQDPPQHHARWLRCKASIGLRLTREDADGWLAGLQLRALTPERIVLGGIANSFFRNRIAKRFRALIVESLREGFPELGLTPEPALDLHVERPAGARGAFPATFPTPGSDVPGTGLPGATPPGGLSDAQAPAGQSFAGSAAGSAVGGAAAHAADRAAGSASGAGADPAGGGLNARQTFDTFLAAAGSDSALRFAQQAVAEPGGRFNPLVLVGQTGLGKTHLLQAISAGLRAAQPQDCDPPPGPVLYVTGEAFKNEVLDGITRKRMPALRERYRAAGALLLDDLEFLLISPKAQEELLHTFDVLHRAGRQLVFASARFPRALTGLADALRSRLEAGLIAELTPPDLEARRRLLEQRAAAEGLLLPPDVALLLATRITRNLRRLEGALLRLSAHAALHGTAITPAFAERYAAPFFDTEPNGTGLPVARDVIVERVAERFGLTVRAVKGRGRSTNLAGARRIAVHLLKHLADCSYSEIGTVLGNRSHSTMVHAHQALLADMARDPHLEQSVLQLTRELGDE